MAEPLPEISREQADLLLRQLHAALGTPRAGERVGSGGSDNASAGASGDAGAGLESSNLPPAVPGGSSELHGRWVCPMHPTEIHDEPGSCGICGMEN